MNTCHVLGPLAVRADGVDRTPRGPKIRKVLALLAVRAGQVVSLRTFADELWENRPPRTAITTIRTHIYHLRRSLAVATPDLADAVVTEPTGYRLAVDPRRVDATLFHRAVDRGRGLLAAGSFAEASGALHEALAMWQGSALADLTVGPVLARDVDHLDELRIDALELRIEADLALGGHRRLVAELRGLVAAHPLNEWFHARLIDALARSGRRGDALRAYLDLRHLLDRELGLEPSLELQQLQQDVLRGIDRRHGDQRPADRAGAGRLVGTPVAS